MMCTGILLQQPWSGNDATADSELLMKRVLEFTASFRRQWAGKEALKGDLIVVGRSSCFDQVSKNSFPASITLGVLGPGHCILTLRWRSEGAVLRSMDTHACTHIHIQEYFYCTLKN